MTPQLPYLSVAVLVACSSPEGKTAVEAGTSADAPRGSDASDAQGHDARVPRTDGQAPRIDAGLRADVLARQDAATETGVTIDDAVESRDGSVVLFGGMGPDGGFLDDTWIWDGTSWTHIDAAGPSARAFASMATLDGTVVLFGGENGSPVGPSLGDTWTWGGGTWTKNDVVGPTERYGAAFAPTSGGLLLYGGVTFTSGDPCSPDGDQLDDYFVGDTWAWDGNLWTVRSTGACTSEADQPGPPVAATLGTRVVLVGESPPSAIVGTWTWNGTAWAEQSGGPA